MILPLALAAAGTLSVGGWIACHNRPAARARRLAQRSVQLIEVEKDQLERIVGSAEKALIKSAAAYASKSVQNQLASVPVEDLKNYGAVNVRWSALRGSGIRTAADLKRLSHARIQARPGIGPVSSWKIQEALALLDQKVRETPISPPAVGDESREGRSTIRAAADLFDLKALLGEVQSRVGQELGTVRARHSQVVKHTGFWREILGGKRRRQQRDAAINEAVQLHNYITLLCSDGQLIEFSRSRREVAERVLSRSITDAELEQKHREHYAAFTAIIERALPGAAARPRGNTGGLTAEIIERVQAFPLKTNLLRVTLRGYQEFGAKYLLAQRRTLLGDEMGLGKTVEALAVLAHLTEVNEGCRFLVISPASVLHNWVRETQHHTTLKAHLLHGSDRDRNLRAWMDMGGVAVTSYTTLQSLRMSPSKLSAAVDALIVDEAHYVKNPDTNRSRAVKQLAQDVTTVVFMSGTPIENRLREFAKLIGYLQPAVTRRLNASVVNTGDIVIGHREFHEVVAPVYLRRNQEDVLTELPERIDKEEWVTLTSSEQAKYRDAVFSRNIMAMRTCATIGIGPGASSKLDRLAELLDEYADGDHKVLVFSYFLDVLHAIERRFADRVIGKITGSVPSAERQALCDALKDQQGHAILAAQVEAGGVGLNLQSASVVILMEPQWKPSTEEQAIARAHRMGQTRTVMVHRLLSLESVDERMTEVLAEKQEVFDTYARRSAIKEGSSESTSTMSKQVIDAELKRLGITQMPAQTNKGAGNHDAQSEQPYLGVEGS